MKSLKYITPFVLMVLLLLTVGGTDQPKTSGRAMVYDSAEKVSPVLVGTKIPDVAVRDIKGTSVKLTELISQKPTVLIFYRGGWCPYCNRHLAQLMDIEQDILDAGFQILAVSPDKPEELQKTLDQHELNYTLLSDSTAEAIKAFGIAFRVDEPTLERYKTFNIDLNAASGYDHNILPVPAVFLVDTDGTILFEYVNPVYSVRLHPSILLAAVKAAKK